MRVTVFERHKIKDEEVITLLYYIRKQENNEWKYYENDKGINEIKKEHNFEKTSFVLYFMS